MFFQMAEEHQINHQEMLSPVVIEDYGVINEAFDLSHNGFEDLLEHSLCPAWVPVCKACQ
jgi:hypothetical protein